MDFFLKVFWKIFLKIFLKIILKIFLKKMRSTRALDHIGIKIRAVSDFETESEVAFIAVMPLAIVASSRNT